MEIKFIYCLLLFFVHSPRGLEFPWELLRLSMRFPRTFPAGPSCMFLFHLNIRKHENNPSVRSEGEKSMIWNRITFPREKALKHPRGVKNTPETRVGREN